VLTTDYKHCQKMEAHKSPYRKGPWYGTFRFQKGVDHLFSMRDEAKHSATRTKVGPGYAGTFLVVRRPLSSVEDRSEDNLYSQMPSMNMLTLVFSIWFSHRKKQ
jgi:hypothetical protein